MSLNSEEEKRSLKESLRNTEDLNATVSCLEHILTHKSPFALYVATADRKDCTWIFDPTTIYQMVGGESTYDRIYDELFPSDEEKAVGIIFFIFKKVGPIYSIRIDLDLINEILDELYDEL
jgi:hypothetical protein